MSPPGNTALPPLPGAGGVMATASTGSAGSSWTSPDVGNPAPPTDLGPRSGAFDASQGRIDLPTRLVDRVPASRLALAGLAVVVLLGAIGMVGLKAFAGGPSYPKAWDARVTPIAEWVAQQRGLAFEHPVQVDFLSDADYSARTRQGGGAAQQMQVDDELGLLRALGLVSGSPDLVGASKTLHDDGTLAYYDQDEKRVFVRGTELTPGVRVTLAHELTHVLQDQHFDLTRLSSLPDDQATVLRSLAEGDATRIEQAYRAKVLTPVEQVQYRAEQNKAVLASRASLDRSVPPAMTTWFEAPYILGTTLVASLAQTGGNTAIDDAFTTPPSEEALFDPRLVGSPAAAAGSLSVTTPGGAKTIDQGTFGATSWYLVLAGRIPAKQALTAADGLKADAYVQYRTGQDVGRVCIRVKATADTPADATQLRNGLTAWATKGPRGAATVSGSGSGVTFQACDPGAKAPASGSVTSQLLVLPATRTAAYGQAIAAGRAPAVARCYSDAVVQRFTLAQLASNDLRAAAAARPTMLGLMAACG